MPRPRKSEATVQAPAEAAENAAVAARTETAAETRYSAESLRRNARELFRVNPEVVDGALYGTSAQELTVTEAHALIKAYLQREVR